MQNIYLARHGQTLFNVQHKIQGFCDSPLTTTGIQQAIAARDHLKELDIQFDDAYSSTSERASDTLEILTNIPYKRVKELREWHFGSYEGEGEHLNPPLPYNDFFVQFGGESQQDLTKRIVSAISEIAKNSSGDNILIVSHGAAIANFYRHWEHTSNIKRDGKISNCSLFHYEFENDKFKLQSIIEHDLSSI